MIVSCDPYRHALLVHFGRRQRPTRPRVHWVPYGTEIAVDDSRNPPELVAIHFVRHRYQLPFLEGERVLDLHVHFGFRREGDLVCFDFCRESRGVYGGVFDCVDAFDGLTLLYQHIKVIPSDRLGAARAGSRRPTCGAGL